MKYCLLCFEDVQAHASIVSYFHYRDCICYKCRSKMAVQNKWRKMADLDVYTLYTYDPYLESILFQYKEGRDVALKDLFLLPYQKQIETMFKDYTIVFMPSSTLHTQRRGFVPLACMFENIHLEKKDLLGKKREYKQSDQSYENRSKIKDVLYVKEEVKLHKVLLVDDVMTSGNTLLAAYALLKTHCDEIKAFVVCDNHHENTRSKSSLFRHILAKRGGC